MSFAKVKENLAINIENFSGYRHEVFMSYWKVWRKLHAEYRFSMPFRLLPLIGNPNSKNASISTNVWSMKTFLEHHIVLEIFVIDFKTVILREICRFCGVTANDFHFKKKWKFLEPRPSSFRKKNQTFKNRQQDCVATAHLYKRKLNTDQNLPNTSPSLQSLDSDWKEMHDENLDQIFSFFKASFVVFADDFIATLLRRNVLV